jgi:PAS domain S-box-containing protein
MDTAVAPPRGPQPPAAPFPASGTRLAAICAIVAVAAGLVLLGWAADIEPLKRIRPGWVAMNPTTALLFLLAAAALWGLRVPSVASVAPNPRILASRRGLAQALAALVALAGAIKLCEHALGWQTGIDQWLFAAELGGDGGRARRNEIAPNTALAFLLAGTALLLLDRGTRPGRRPSEWLAAAVALSALVALLGYAYRVESMYGITRFIPMAAHTAVLFLLLATGLLVARRTLGAAALFSGDRPDSRMARRLLLGSIAIVAGIGWLRLAGERAGLYGTELGVTLHTATVIALFALLVAGSAWALHRAEDERRHAEDERARLFAVTPDLLCVAGFDGRFRSLNPSWETVLGWTLAELRARPFLEFVHPEDRAESIARLQTLAEGVPAIAFENRFLTRDGGWRCFSWNAMPVPEEGAIYASGRDVTEAREAARDIRALNEALRAKAAELEQSNRELESFSYTVSHDLRAPLRHIDGYARMLQEDAADALDGDCRRYLDEIGIAARRMGALIDDLLAFSRLGRKPLERVPLDMRRLVERVVEECGGAGKVEVGPLPEAQADPVLLRQVWVNLVSNALKYSAPRGDDARVEIDGWREGDRLEYRIRDNGVGFDMRFADKLFGVFQRLHSQEEFEGTGVGLAIVQQIVARHGGGIRADATPGAGAAFTFDLPAGAHAGQSALAREDAA